MTAATLPTWADELAGELTQFAVRMLQEALETAMPWHWMERAEALEAARPRSTDFCGRATAEELAARDALLAEQAESCRRHARFLTAYPDPIAAIVAADVLALSGGVDNGNRD